MKNSPNPVHHFWRRDLLEFKVYDSCKGELEALTRSKAWVSLSSVGKYPTCQEMRQAIKNRNIFTFNHKPLGRVMGEEILT